MISASHHAHFPSLLCKRRKQVVGLDDDCRSLSTENIFLSLSVPSLLAASAMASRRGNHACNARVALQSVGENSHALVGMYLKLS